MSAAAPAGDPSRSRSSIAPSAIAPVTGLRFSSTVVYVSDVAATLDFYERAFGTSVRFVHDSGEYAELETGDTTLAFSSEPLSATALDDLPGGFAPNRPDRAPAGFDLAFWTDDIPGAWGRALEAGATIVSTPVDKPWGQTVGYLRDLNGLLVEIGTRVDQDRDDRPGVDG